MFGYFNILFGLLLFLASRLIVGSDPVPFWGSDPRSKMVLVGSDGVKIPYAVTYDQAEAFCRGLNSAFSQACDAVGMIPTIYDKEVDCRASGCPIINWPDGSKSWDNDKKCYHSYFRPDGVFLKDFRVVVWPHAIQVRGPKSFGGGRSEIKFW